MSLIFFRLYFCKHRYVSSNMRILNYYFLNMHFVVVNYIYQTKFKNFEDLALENIASQIPKAHLHPRHPRQVVSRIRKVMCMFFRKGSIHIMGGADSEIEMEQSVLKYLQNYFLFWIPPHFECTPIYLLQVQTMTVTSSLPKPINLYKFHECIKSNYDLSLLVLSTLPSMVKCVNLFGTGKMVLTGCKKKTQNLLQKIYIYITLIIM